MEAVDLLKKLIAAPSFSTEEDRTAGIISGFLASKHIVHKKMENNVFAFSKNVDPEKFTVLLNSHHDTVKPNKGYTHDPFLPIEKDGKLYGLGSNDAGGCLVSLLMVFLYFYERDDLPFNLVFAASAEEEISGSNGIELLLPHLGRIDCAIVGEPTQLEMAVAERGLMVVECEAIGKAGHAARNEGENALYKALEDINWIRKFEFEKVSELLGKSQMTVTVIDTFNQQHNVVPASCTFIIDVRLNELYAFEEVLHELKVHLKSRHKPRSTRLKSSSISLEHPLVRSGLALGKGYFGSPTTSDKALMPFPALKMGPGDSARSHSADEFIFVHEIKEGIETYIEVLEKLGEELKIQK